MMTSSSSVSQLESDTEEWESDLGNESEKSLVDTNVGAMVDQSSINPSLSSSSSSSSSYQVMVGGEERVEGVVLHAPSEVGSELGLA